MKQPEPKFKALGERMKEARLATAYRRRETVSQERIAELLTKLVGRHISQAAWSFWERGQREPELDVIRAVASLSGLTPDYIAFGPTEVEKAPPTNPLTPVSAAKKGRRAG